MASLNKVMLIGNLGKDPEIRHTPDGSAVASFSMAVSEKWTDKSGQKQESTEWCNIVAWRGLAEVAQKYLSKGSKVYIEGKLKTRKWNDRDGNPRTTTEIVAQSLIMLDSRGSGSSGSGSSSDSEDGWPGITDNDIPF